MIFHQLTLPDREAMQAVTLSSGRRNCNYTFANLVGWKFLFGTEVESWVQELHFNWPLSVKAMDENGRV